MKKRCFFVRVRGPCGRCPAGVEGYVRARSPGHTLLGGAGVVSILKTREHSPRRVGSLGLRTFLQKESSVYKETRVGEAVSDGGKAIAVALHTR